MCLKIFTYISTDDRSVLEIEREKRLKELRNVSAGLLEKGQHKKSKRDILEEQILEDLQKPPGDVDGDFEFNLTSTGMYFVPDWTLCVCTV